MFVYFAIELKLSVIVITLMVEVSVLPEGGLAADNPVLYQCQWYRGINKHI